MQRMALLFAVAIAVAVSGCFGFGSQRLSDAEAREATQDALREFAQDFASPDGGDLRLVRGEFGGQDLDAPVAGEVTFEMEWGAEGRSRVSLHASGSGATYDISLHCSTDSVIVTYGDARLERRPADGSCLDSLGTSDPLEVRQLDDNAIEDVEPHRDGSVTATLASAEGNMTAKIDEDGRLERLDFAEGGFLAVEYGQRQTIQMPAATGRIPVLVFGAGQFAEGQYVWTAVGGEETVAYNEIQVRVVDPSNTTMAAFTIQSGTQTQGNFEFTFTDDGDGVFGANDTFTVQSDAWTEPDQYEVLVWDTWADRAVGDIPIPGLHWLAALGAVAILARRR